MNLIGKVGCLVMLLLSVCEISAGKLTIKNETGRDLLRVDVSHWGYVHQMGAKGILKGTYKIKKGKKIEHDLVLDRLESIFVEGLGMSRTSGPNFGKSASAAKLSYSDNYVESAFKEWPNKHSSSKNRTITIKVAPDKDVINKFVISDKLG